MIQEIFKLFGKDYQDKYNMSIEQYKVYNSIINCKTKAYGGHIYECEKCHKKVYSYNACKNRHCPNCQDYKKEKWLLSHQNDILNVQYYHVVLTLPGELHKVFYHNKRVCYNIIIKCASEVIIELASNKEYLGAIPGIVSMLHTWTQVAAYHPHVHMIVTAGGLTQNGTWIDSKKDLPIDIIEKKFKTKVINALKKANLKFYNDIEYLNDKKNLYSYLDNLYNKTWTCYLKTPFNNIASVYKYLAKYVYKVCMTNERIVKINKKSVTFIYKDSDDRSIEKKMTIKGDEFIRRFLLHTLPKGFMKIRYYGIYAGKNKKKRIKRLKLITKTLDNKKRQISKLELLNKINGFDVTRCKNCNGKLVLTRIIEKKKPPDRINISNGYVNA